MKHTVAKSLSSRPSANLPNSKKLRLGRLQKWLGKTLQERLRLLEWLHVLASFFCVRTESLFRPRSHQFPAPRWSKYPKAGASAASNDSSFKEARVTSMLVTMSWGLNMTFALCQQIDVPLTSVLDARRPPIPELSVLRMPALSVCMCGAESGATLCGNMGGNGGP